MGLFSFGSKEKDEAWEAERKRRARRPETCNIRLTEAFGTTELDRLLEDYAPETWERTKTILKAAGLCVEIISDDDKKLDAIISRLDDISRRLDALERAQEIPQRER